MREILFRGKTNKQLWVYGNLTVDVGGHSRIQFDARQFAVVVNPETVGQFTGLTDKNGVKIFDDDIVKNTRIVGRCNLSTNHQVYFDTELLQFGLKYSFEMFHCQFSHEFEVIGNIHDNPELLEK